MTTPTKIIWISDLHITENGIIAGIACRVRLEQLIEEIRRYHSDALCCVITGDLADSGTPDEYSPVSELLDRLDMPVLPLIGNHDKRSAFQATFPAPGLSMDGYQQFRWDHVDLTFLCLDTLSEGEACGRLDARRLDWIENQLTDCRDRRVLVFMHHPPGCMWMGPQDDIMLRDEMALIDLLSGSPDVKYLFCGHVHRPVSGVVGGVPFTTLRALAHQTRPGHQTWDWDDFVSVDERPQYGLILIAQDRIVVQAIDLENPA